MIDRRSAIVPGRAGRRSRAARLVLIASLAVGVVFVSACAVRSAVPITAPSGTVLATGRAVRSLQRDLAAIFDAEPFARTTWAVLVQSLDRRDVLYARDAGRLVMPASNMKIVTLATAAETLGWDYRFETRFLAAGPVAGGVLAGDLVVVGGGDPSINSRGGAATQVFDQWARRLREAGINRIAGRVIGDGRAFPGEPLGQGWAWDYLGYGYAAPVSALQFNENLAELVITPGARRRRSCHRGGAPGRVHDARGVPRPHGRGWNAGQFRHPACGRVEPRHRERVDSSGRRRDRPIDCRGRPDQLLRRQPAARADRARHRGGRRRSRDRGREAGARHGHSAAPVRSPVAPAQRGGHRPDEGESEPVRRDPSAGAGPDARRGNVGGGPTGRIGEC